MTADTSDHDWKVEKTVSSDTFKITDMETNETTEVDMSSFDFEHNSLIKLNGGSQIGEQTFQLMSAENDIKFNFYYQGGKVETLVYDEAQYRLKDFMAPVVKIDTTKSILSPMPGAVVSVAVQPGDTVVDGQELCIIEAMKMQNILKSEREGVIKSVNVKAGDSVAVDELLIEFE
jgi:biotin carboxyl carrier protein